MKTLLAGVVSLMLAIASPCIRAELYPVSFDQRSAMAERVIVGQVVRQHTYLVPDRGVMTASTVKVKAWLKGVSDETDVIVLSLGGVFEDRATIAKPSLDLDFGQDYLLFLDAEEITLHDPTLRSKRPGLRQSFAYADVQGAMPMQQARFRDTFGAHKSAEEALVEVAKFSDQPALTPRGTIWIPTLDAAKDLIAPKAIASFLPTTTRAGTIVAGDLLSIAGAGFGAPGSVFYRNADSGGSGFTASGVASDNTVWTDAAITNKVASEAGTGQIMVNGSTSAGTLTIEWAHTDINSDFAGFGVATRQRFYLRNLNGTGGLSLRYNTGSGLAGNAPAVASFERAMSSWRCGAGVHFAPGGTTANGLNGMDGVNVVLFDGTLGAGVLGQAVSNFNGSANGGCNLQNTVWWLNDLDIRMRTDPPTPGFPWEYGPAAPSGSEMDFESVAVHEIGHGVGLGHRIAVGQTMHFNIANGVSARTPNALEIVGAQNKMAYSTAATCFNPAGSGTPMVAVAPGSCNLSGPGVNIFLNGFE